MNAGHDASAAACRCRPSTVYYNDKHHHVTVDSTYFVSGSRRYAIRKLTRVVQAGGRIYPGTVPLMTIAAVQSLLLAAVTVVAGAVVGWVLTLLAVTVSATGVGWWAVRRRSPYVLYADYQGDTVLLFATFDAREFGQLTRALGRAREAVGCVR